jgi:hypothetical protein
VKPSVKIVSAVLLGGCALVSLPVLAGVATHVLPEGWTLSGSNPQNYDIGIETVAGAPGKSVYIKWRTEDEPILSPAEVQKAQKAPEPPASPASPAPAPSPAPPAPQVRDGQQPDLQRQIARLESRVGTLGSSGGQFRTFRLYVGGYVTVLQTISADDYIGKRLQFSAMLKTDDADGAQLFMRMNSDDPNPLKSVLNFYSMDDRPITGSTKWARYNVVLDVPDKTKVITFGFMLKGRGEMWANGIKLEEVGKKVRASAMPNNPLPKAPVNLNFER